MAESLPSMESAYYEPPPAPEFDVDSTSFAHSTTVEITGADDTVIYYTTDGSDPRVSGEIYEEPLTITRSTLIRAVALRDGYMSPVVQIRLLCTTPVAPRPRINDPYWGG